MPVTVTAETEGYEKLEAVLLAAGERGENLSAAFARIMFDFQQEQEQVFAASGAFGGRGGWEPLSEKYGAWKARITPGAPILTLTGNMRGSLTDAKALGAVRTVTADELFIGTDIMVGSWNLAWLHADGTETMPARPPIRVTEDQLERWMEIILKHLTGASTGV